MSDRLCPACDEFHPVNTMCPPHEMRSRSRRPSTDAQILAHLQRIEGMLHGIGQEISYLKAMRLKADGGPP